MQCHLYFCAHGRIADQKVTKLVRGMERELDTGEVLRLKMNGKLGITGEEGQTYRSKTL